MKFLTILALLVAVCAVFLGVGRGEETADDLREADLEDVNRDDRELLEEIFMNLESHNNDDDDETENALAYIEETLSDEEDKPEMFKRSPRRGAWWRRVRDRLRRFRDRLRNVGRRICRFLRNSSSQTIRRVCNFVQGRKRDEVYPRISDDESFISAEEAKELLKQPGWVFQKNNE